MAGVPQIDIESARTLLGEGHAVFVDIRDPGSFRASHIPAAVHLTDASVSAFLEATDRECPLVVYCYHGNSSQTATRWLMERGFTKVASMAGGFEAWRAAFPEATAAADLPGRPGAEGPAG